MICLRDFSWGTFFFKCWCCDLFRRSISTELNTGLGRLVQKYWYITKWNSFNFSFLLIYLCFIQRAVVTEHRRSIVWSYFAAVNENIAKCDVYRKSGHYCGNTTNRFKHRKKHEKKYRAAAAKKGARGVKCLISTQTPQHWDGVHWQRGIQVYTVQ